MTKPKTKKKLTLKQFIINHTRHIINCGYLSHFKFDGIYKSKRGSLMEIKTDYEYLAFDLGYNEKKLQKIYDDKRYDVIINTLCHEMSHIATGEITERLRIDESPKQIRYYRNIMADAYSRHQYTNYENYKRNLTYYSHKLDPYQRNLPF